MKSKLRMEILEKIKAYYQQNMRQNTTFVKDC